ncbi:intercellular adhesion molecule 5 isoform X1 [Astyanax mexicanus]|uniref:intercellular adhesion molecule 5 isoform X1 n=2 Tax=Astyanax mexicanus TaxID=7994 RepID=UPI0020CB4462|nr:intercellular adhesion molecule 5 isoform X1 [Astyanax mexicanus]
MLRLLLLKLMGLMLVGLVKGDLCPITLHPAEVVVEYGASASANCSTSNPHEGMGWVAFQGPVDETNDVQFIIWSVDNIEEWDITPFCYINKTDDDQCTVSLPVTVYKIPDGVFISTVGHTGPMIEEQQYELQCALQDVAPVGNVIVKWYKGDTQVGNTTFSESSKTPDKLLATLQISPSRDDDGAQYRCKAELNLGPKGPQPPPAVMSDPLNITVKYKPVSACSNWSPVISTTLDSYPFPFVGNPPPRLTWYFRGSKVDPTKQLGKHDSGQYLYTAINTVHMGSCLLNITVEYGPEIAPGDDSAEVNRGLNVSLTCKADGNPKPVLRWSFNNQPMATGKGEATLTISRAKVTDSGEYLCTAANKIGTQTKRVSLVVKDICPITLRPSEVLVKYGDSVSAICSTSITHEGMDWEASQGQVNETNDVQFITWSVDSLEKWDISPSCYINLIDDNQCRVHLNVTIYKIPDSVSISIVGETGPVVEGRQYELQCDIQNVAPVEFLTVKWYKRETLVGNLTFTDSRTTPKNEVATLQISPSRDDDGAQYTCEAELDLGPEGPQPPPAVMSDPLNITVHYKPEIICSDWSPVSNTPLSSCPFPVMGNPTPELSWLQRGSLVESTKRLRKDDSGQYQYIATNSIGRATCVTNITVKYAPEFVSREDSVEVDRGMNTSLFCKAEGDPVPEVSWSFENITKATGIGQTTLNISGARPADGGEYTCTATNTFGSQTRRVSLVVHNCPITLHPAEVVVEHGASASANCSTSMRQKGMGWEASQGQVDMMENVQFVTWSVKSIEEWDIAPFCYMTLYEADQCQVSLPVTVYKIPDGVWVSIVGHTGPMIEGRQYELKCALQNVAPVGNVIVKWYKGDTQVGNTTFSESSKTPENLLTTLQISPSRDDDGAQYRCEAELNLGPKGPQPPPAKISDPLNITVLYKPVSACSNWSPVINTTLDSYPFPFVGNPPPRHTWYFRGSKVDPTKHLGKHDSGEYLYTAINTVHIVSCSLNITVEYGPTFDCLKNYKWREHSLFSHNCTALASPVATVSWIKDGENVQPPRNITRRDNGLYIIRAKNKYGTVDHHLYLNVLYAPVIALKEESVAVYKGNAVSLLCKAEGNPEPEVIWRFNNQIKLTGKREAILNISGVTAADSGVYTCTAKNELGSQERRVEVLVAVKENTIQIVPIIIVLVLIIIILICIFLCLKKRRMRRYNVTAANGVNMSLLGNGKSK